MSAESILKHSVIFEVDNVQKNTYDDWLFVPSERPVIVPPEVKTNFIDLPGANGFIDLTEAIPGSVVYGQRESSIDFMIETTTVRNTWSDLYSAVLNFLHGKSGKLILEDDPNWFYEGRFTVEPWKSEESWSTITINYVLEPFKVNLNTGRTSL